jgi:hypothetical protein
MFTCLHQAFRCIFFHHTLSLSFYPLGDRIFPARLVYRLHVSGRAFFVAHSPVCALPFTQTMVSFKEEQHLEQQGSDEEKVEERHRSPALSNSMQSLNATSISERSHSGNLQPKKSSYAGTWKHKTSWMCVSCCECVLCV